MMPSHQHPAAVPIDSRIPKVAAPPQIIRSSSVGTLDLDQLATVLARIMEL
jgi:hypothetical protein